MSLSPARACGEPPVNPTDRDHHEDTIRAIIAIAKVLGVTPREVHRLRAYRGPMAFWIGRMLCTKADELDRHKANAGDQSTAP